MAVRNEYVISTLRSPADTRVLEDPGAVGSELGMMSSSAGDGWRLVAYAVDREGFPTAAPAVALSERRGGVAPRTPRAALKKLAVAEGWVSLALDGRVVWAADAGDLEAYRLR